MNQQLPVGAADSAKWMGLCAHSTCRSTMPSSELSAILMIEKQKWPPNSPNLNTRRYVLGATYEAILRPSSEAQNSFWINKLRAGGRHDIPPPRPATEARSGSLKPGRPSLARSANTRHPAGRPHTPPADRMYATDVRHHHRLMPPWAVT